MVTVNVAVLMMEMFGVFAVVPMFVIHAVSPLGAKVMRSGLLPTGILVVKVLFSVSMTWIWLTELPATHSCEPSGLSASSLLRELVWITAAGSLQSDVS